MSSGIGKCFDYLNGAAELSGKIAVALQNYIAARTAIRDYIISTDEEHYKSVKELTELAMEDLVEADTMVEKGQSLDVIGDFLGAIREWTDIAREVHDEFAQYQKIVNTKVLTNFSALAQSGNALLQANPPVMTNIILDVQIANVAVVSYLQKSEDKLVEDAKIAIDAAQKKITEIEGGDEQTNSLLQVFSNTLKEYLQGFLETVEARKKANKLFNKDLAPLGDKIQTELETFYDQIIEIQRGINDMKTLAQARKKDGPLLH